MTTSSSLGSAKPDSLALRMRRVTLWAACNPVSVASLSLTWAATVAVLTPAMAADTALGG